MDLTTKYMGLKLKNPIVPSASPLSQSINSVKAMEDAGASAVVVYSLFEEQITHESGELDHYLSVGTESFAEALSYFPEHEKYYRGPDQYLNHIAKLKKAVDIPIIGCLNGVSAGGWIKYAQNIEQALVLYNSVLRLAPNFVAARYNMASLMKQTGNLDEALRQLILAARYNPKGSL